MEYMKKMIKEWNITISDFEGGGWGNVMGKFKVYSSLLSAWTKKVPRYDLEEFDKSNITYRYIGVVNNINEIANPQPGDLILFEPFRKSIKDSKKEFMLYASSGWLKQTIAVVPILDANNSQVYESRVDIEKIFQEITIMYILALESIFPVLRRIGYRRLGSKRTKELLKVFVLSATQFALTNRSVLERVGGISKNGTGISINVEDSRWFLTPDMCGRQARSALDASEIQDYDIIGIEQAQVATENGNVKFISKFDPTEVIDS